MGARPRAGYRSFAEDLLGGLSDNSAALEGFSTSLMSDGRNGVFDATAGQFEQFSRQVQASGFAARGRSVDLHKVGLTDARIYQLQSTIAGGSYLGFSVANLQNSISGSIDANVALSATFQMLVSNMDQAINALLLAASPTWHRWQMPAAPTSLVKGWHLCLTEVSRIHRTTGIASYQWDLDGDSQFDDATGVTPNVSLNTVFAGYVGLLVTDSTGRENVDYAPVVVNRVNHLPVITSRGPTSALASLTVGEDATFSLGVSDPEGDPVAIDWYLDGIHVATGASYTFHSTASTDRGLHFIRAVATDQGPLGGSVYFEWTASVSTLSEPPVAADDVATSHFGTR